MMASNKIKSYQGPRRLQSGNILNEEIKNEINIIENEIDLKFYYTNQWHRQVVGDLRNDSRGARSQAALSSRVMSSQML
jgi:hypothetical protein